MKTTKKQVKEEWELIEKETKGLLKIVEKFIRKHYGPRCPTKAPLCPVCRVWIALDNLKVNL